MTKLIRAFFAMIMLTLLSACGGGGGSAGNTSGVALYTSASDKITISPGEIQNYKIAGGIPNYVATSSSSAVTVQVVGSALRITGGNGGSATIVITDASGAKVLIEATVGAGIDLYTTAPSVVSVGVGGTSAVYSIGGGSQVYTVTTSDKRIASVGQTTSGEFVISGQSGGKAVVTVKDTLGSEVKIDVVVGTVDALFSTAADEVTVSVGGTNSYKVGGGTTIYFADSSDIGVARAVINGSDLVITGVSTGKATVVVRDSTTGSLTIKVTVGSGVPTPLFTTASSSIVVAPSTSPSFTIGGGRAPYRVSSSNSSVLTAFVSGTTLSLTGVARGAAKVVVTDSAGATVSIDVTVGTGSVVPLFTTAPSSVTIVVPSSATYSIGGGTAPYTVTSSNIAVASVTSSESGFVVKGEATGASQVVVRDALGASVTVSVTVTAAVTVPVAVLPGDSTGAVGDTLTFNISGGTSPYTVSNNNPSIATVAQTGNSFTAKLLNVGSTKVTVFDSLNKSVEVTVTASAATSQLRISPATITVGEDFTNDISLTIFGGTGPYRAFTSDLVLSSVPGGAIAQATDGTAFIVGLGSQTTRCIASGTRAITLTILDSKGASATSTMTIQDNGKGGAGCL